MDAEQKLKEGALLAYRLSATYGDDTALSLILKDAIKANPETWPHIVNAALVTTYKQIVPGFLEALDERIVLPDGSRPGGIFKETVREMIAEHMTEAD